MIAQVIGGTIKYTASTGDWLAEVAAQDTSILIVFQSNICTMKMSSGTNYDNLATFIAEVKADAISRGINWSGN
jgi:hypothetical protein